MAIDEPCPILVLCEELLAASDGLIRYGKVDRGRYARIKDPEFKRRKVQSLEVLQLREGGRRQPDAELGVQAGRIVQEDVVRLVEDHELALLAVDAFTLGRCDVEVYGHVLADEVAKLLQHGLIGASEALVSVKDTDPRELPLQHDHRHDDAALSLTGRYDQQDARAFADEPGDADGGHRVLAGVRGEVERLHGAQRRLSEFLKDPDLGIGHDRSGFIGLKTLDGHLSEPILHRLLIIELDPVLCLLDIVLLLLNGLFLLDD